MQTVLIRQDRPYHSRKTVAALANQQILFFNESGQTANVNLDIPNQISNSADYDLHQLGVKLFKKDGTPFLLDNAADLAFLQNVAYSGFLKMQINKIDQWSASLYDCGLANVFAALAAPSVQNGNFPQPQTIEGRYNFNNTLEIKKGMPFQMSLDLSFAAAPAADTYDIALIFYGILKIFEPVKNY